METQPLTSESPKSSHPHRRLFYWGIGFWILTWIAAICSYQVYYLNIKGCNGLDLGYAAGSLVCKVNESPPVFTKCGVRFGGFIWSNGMMKKIREGPGMMGILASGGWRKRASTTDVSFPIAGFLWLWLAAGWAAEVRYRRLAKVKVGENAMVAHYSRRRLIALTVALTVLGAAVPYLVTRSRQASDKAGCLLAVRNIQQAVRSWSGVGSVNIGEPIVWGDLIGVGKFLSPDSGTCPSGDEYQLSPVNPAMGVLAARCPHPEHQRYILSKGTSDW